MVRVETREKGSRFIATAFPARGAEGALAGAATITVVARARLRVGLPVALDGEARHRVARHGGRVESAGYDDTGRAVLEAVVPRDALAPLINDLQTLARGGATVDEID